MKKKTTTPITQPKTLQYELISKIDSTELASRECLKDLDQRLWAIVMAYSGNMDYGSLQILEELLLNSLKHVRDTKGKIAHTFVEKDMKIHPELKQVVEMLTGKGLNAPQTPQNKARWN